MDKNITIKAIPESLTLRALRVADAELLHALKRQPAMLHGHPGAQYPTFEKTREWIGQIASRRIAMATMVGDILIRFRAPASGKVRGAHAAKIALGMHEAWHRRGIGNALVAERLDLADVLHIARLADAPSFMQH